MKKQNLVGAAQGHCVEDEEVAKEQNVEYFFFEVMLMRCSNRLCKHMLH